MATIDWLVQELSPASDALLVKEIERQGHKVHFWGLRDLLTYNWGSEQEECDARLKLLPKPFKGPIHVSCQMLKHLTPYINHLTPLRELRCQHYYSYWHKYLANDNFLVSTLGLVKANYQRISKGDWDNGWFFMRPDTNDKIFTGQLIKSEREIDDLLYALSPETLVVVADPQEFLAEWRLIVHNGKVISGSLYRQHNEHNENETVEFKHLDPKKLAEEIAAKPFPGLPSIYCMDIAMSSQGEYGLLEIGGINCCGFYSCNLEPIVKAITEETEKLYD